MKQIDVVVPVLGRPENALPVLTSFLDARTVNSTLVFVCSQDDDDQIAACQKARDETLDRDRATRILTVEPRPHGDFAHKINTAYRVTSAPWLFQAADDVEFTPGWDAEALAVATRNERPGVVGTNDAGNPTVKAGRHATHILFRRSYIEDVGASMDGPGIVFHEGYGHQWVDTEVVELAKLRGQWAFAEAAVVKHLHPFWDRSVPMDATYERGQSTAHRDRLLYQQRRKEFR